MLIGEEAWGQIKEDSDKTSFMSTALKFSDGLRRIITNMGGDLQLREVDEPYCDIEPNQKAYELSAESPATVEYCRGRIQTALSSLGRSTDTSCVPFRRDAFLVR